MVMRRTLPWVTKTLLVFHSQISSLWNTGVHILSPLSVPSANDLKYQWENRGQSEKNSFICTQNLRTHLHIFSFLLLLQQQRKYLSTLIKASHLYGCFLCHSFSPIIHLRANIINSITKGPQYWERREVARGIIFSNPSAYLLHFTKEKTHFLIGARYCYCKSRD